MKKQLLFACALFAGFTAQSQVYFSDDFSSGNLNNWTLTNADGDAFEWEIADYAAGDGQGNVATSASWDANAGILTPDNWMVTSAIDLTAATGNVQLLWNAYGQDQAWAQENYTVYVATASDIATLGGSATSFNEVIGTSAGYVGRSLDVSSFIGQTIYVGFRHHNVSDMFRLNIDDVEVRTLVSTDMEMTALTMSPVVAAGNTTITGTVTSLGSDNITSIDITWNDGSGLNSETFPVNLNFGDTYNFSHGTTLGAWSGTYNLDVCVVASGDAFAGNDCLTGSVSAVSSIVPKVTVGEEKTGEWCGWCPRGAVALAEMSLSNPDNFIGIAVHNGDAMAVASYDGNIDTYVPGGYPGGGVDRVLDGDPSDFSSMHASRVSMVPPAAVGVTMVDNGATVDVTVSAYFVGALTGDYRLAAVLLEDNVSGNGQTNYYHDGSAGALSYPNTGSMPNFNFVGGGTTVSPVSHDHVARALGANEINGVAGSLPGTVSDGDLLSHTYTITKGASWDMNNVHPVGMLVNAATGEILNAGKTALAADVSVEEVALNSFNVTTMPNPTSGVSNIVVDLAVAADMNIVVVDVLGNEVYNSGTVSLDAGSYATQVNLTNNAAGVYFAKVNLNGAVKTVKINVVK